MQDYITNGLTLKEIEQSCLSQDFVGDFFLDRFFWLYMVL